VRNVPEKRASFLLLQLSNNDRESLFSSSWRAPRSIKVMHCRPGIVIRKLDPRISDAALRAAPHRG
jgi:hypothetical protein